MAPGFSTKSSLNSAESKELQVWGFDPPSMGGPEAGKPTLKRMWGQRHVYASAGLDASNAMAKERWSPSPKNLVEALASTPVSAVPACLLGSFTCKSGFAEANETAVSTTGISSNIFIDIDRWMDG